MLGGTHGIIVQGFVIALGIFVGGFVATAPAQTSSFAPGERITVVTDKVKVRDGAGLSFNTLGTQDKGATGTILADSGGLVDGYLWLQIDYDSGADGWSAMGDANEAFIEKLANPQQEASTQPETTSETASGEQPDIFSQEFWQTATVEDVQKLLDQGVDFNVMKCDEGCDNPWLSAVSSSPNSDVISLLLNNGYDPNAKINRGITALMLAANPEVVRLLIEYGADVEAKDTMLGDTALTYAVSQNSASQTWVNPNIVNALIQGGANVNAKNEGGETPLMKAVHTAFRFAARANEHNSNPEVVTILIQAGADLNAQNNEGRTLKTTKGERY